MGSYTFRWEHPANEVFVTGTFDNWSKSVQLDKKGSAHEKTVHLPSTSEKIYYKFVADGDWKTDHTAKSEADPSGNINNVLYPTDITPSASTAHISSVGPGATTTAMAGKQPIESSPPPGAFPETPAATADEEQHGDGLLSGALAGAAAFAGAGANAVAGAFGKKDDQTYSVKPLPAFEGASNPIHLAPGEKVPDSSTLTSNTITSQVHDDPSLKSSAPSSEPTFSVAPLPATGGIGNPIHLNPGEKVPDPSTLTGNTMTSNVKLDLPSYENSDSGAPQLPPISPQTEAEAHGAPIFGLGPQTTGLIPESSMGIGKDAPAPLEGAALSSVGPQSTTSQLAGQQPIQPRGVPEVVTESQHKAHVGPEAAANPEAVLEKKQVENELKAKVPTEQAGSNTGISAEGIAGAVAGGAAALGGAAIGAGAYLRNKAQETTTTSQLAGQQPIQPRGVPAVVTESQHKAHVGPEAAANPEAVVEKRQVENELKAKVPTEQAGSSNANISNAGYTAEGISGTVAGGVAALGGAAVGAGAYLRNKTHETTGTDPVSVLPKSVQDSINGTTGVPPTASASVPQQNALGQSVGTAERQTASSVPSEVLASQKQAHVGPEAAANPTAVHEKSAVEKELLSHVKESNASGEPAPTATAATTATAPATSASGAPQLADLVGSGLPPLSLEENKHQSSGLNAPASSQAQVPPTRPTVVADSADVSPLTSPPTEEQTAPSVTTGVASSSAPATSGPTVGTPRGKGAANSTPQKRNSIMDRFRPSSASPSGKDKDTAASSSSPTAEGSEKKKKGIFAGIKEKLRD